MKLASQRYEEIKRTIAEFLEDYDVKEIPIDIFDLAKRMRIQVVYATDLVKMHPNKLDQYFIYSLPNSYFYYSPETQKFLVFIDDISCYDARQKFSLAHEIMHIILGHTEQNSLNETEANFGATYLLAPTSLALLWADKGLLLNPVIVKEIFDVSEPLANIVVRYNQNRVTYCDLIEKDYEKTINSLLKDSYKRRLCEPW